MILESVQVTNFKSIENSSLVPIDFDTTVLVGQNESGKSAFLQALYQARPIFGIDKGFDKTTDYPRKNLYNFKTLHPDGRVKVAVFTLRLTQPEVDNVNKLYGASVLLKGSIELTEYYDGPVFLSNINNLVLEKPFIQHIITGVQFPTPTITAAAKNCKTVKELITLLKGKELSEPANALRIDLDARFGKSTWVNVLALEVYQKHLEKRMPKFFYFDEYRILPGKINLKYLQTRIEESNNEDSPKPLTHEEESSLALLQMANLNLPDLLKNKSHEEARANLEGVSNQITDLFLKFWRQNINLEVVLDIDEDSTDISPFNEGPNIYVRIKNTKHRVTLPFNQRSKGFVWFFSFLVWFNSVRARVRTGSVIETPIILLLDEPGLNLHASAQSNLLNYIDFLAETYQVIYSTHSPFMVHSDRLSQARVVEEKENIGTVISDRLDSSDSSTLYPLQAALGYTIAQNLFISKRNLLVEGISDLTYLQFFSNACEAAGKEGLRTDITIMPTGGVDKISTFVSLLGANNLDLAIVHDYDGKPEAKLDNLIKDKILNDKYLLTYAAYRNPTGKKPTKAEQTSFIPTDVEDLFSIDLYLKLFCETYKQQLNGELIAEGDLPLGKRIVERLERFLASKKIKVRPTDGFNHYAPAKALLSTKLPIDADTIERFASLFKDVNKLFLK
jgi:hypothetical protein